MEPPLTALPPRIAKLPVKASVCLGHQAMTLSQLSRLRPGTVIPLSISSSTPQQLMVNELVLATGTLVRRGIRLGFHVTSPTGEVPST
jgi:flagellar motor switch/type III secretory pathway protein FliN